MRVAILGYSGSGKSTLAKYLGNVLNTPVLYLDTVQFKENWLERDKKEAINIVSDFMNKKGWIIEGNYIPFLQNERLEKADYIIYFAFSRFNCLYRAIKRFFKYRNTNRESISVGCNEKIDIEFIWWILHQGRNKNIKNHYKKALSPYKNKVFILKNQKQLNDFMLNITDFIK